ncbi:hypothetical protein ADL26_05445 [Thermoactinomyces vulgaris]|jgi:type I restriction enzyme, S subunit|nr:hypothetical protein ADL26_05445 [Thermoactinomyces vulgaris]
MSKKKKKSVEELLEEALVPEEEQPYKVPENWVWIRLGKVTSINPTKPKLLYQDDLKCSFLPMSKVDPESGRIIQLEERPFFKVKKGYTYFQESDVLFAKITPCMENGNSVIAKGLLNGFGFGSTEFYVFRSTKAVDHRYIYHLVRSSRFRNQAKQVMTGAVGQQRVPKSFLEAYKLPLPPVNEQKRIVDRLERLLNKIDEAKQLIEEAKETFELRRAAILDKAFRGELSSDWRKLNQIKAPLNKEINKKIDTPPYSLPDSWSWVRLEDVCEKITDGTHHSPKSYSEGDYMYITAKNIKEQGIILDNVTYVSEEVHRDIYNRCDVKKGDVLYIKDGATTGIATVNHLNEEFSLLSSVGVLRTRRELLSPDYLSFCLNSPSTKERMLGMMSGNAIRRLTLKKIKQGIVPLPPIDEQMYIVNKLKHLFEVLYCEKSIIEKVESQLNSLKQSILSRAFRGELGTHDPTEESALELLKEVLSCD